ncbi:MAG: hypothetical protein MMC23_008587 [Stictis urceolatum]|nr:hypothetical protein [Stictis urceolata]
MPTTRHPPLPAGVRLALPSDIPRLGLLFVASFHYSPNMKWARPLYPKFPEDTIAWYTTESRKFLLDPKYITLVATDAFDPDERSKTDAHFPDGVKTMLGDVKPGEQVPVAIGVWEVGSERGRAWREAEGRVLEGKELPGKPELLFRDRHQGHYDTLKEKVMASYEKWFKGLVELDMLATHPAYWGRGHGSKLVRWGLEYSRLNGVGQGVVGPPMGMRVYLKSGFVLKDKMTWDGDEITPEGLGKEVAVYKVDWINEKEGRASVDLD